MPGWHTNAPAASLALQAEGVDHHVAPCSGEHGYAQLLASLWRAGTGFVLVEWDIAPWPGAVEWLTACKASLCAHRYCNGGFEGGFGYSLGCLKVAAELSRRVELPAEIEQTHWKDLDTAFWRHVGPYVRVHKHEPGVAHIRRLFG